MTDTMFLEHWKDVLSDDLGVWNPSGTKTYYYSRTVNRSVSITIKPVDDETDADFIAKRFLYSYPTEKQFKRVIVKPCMKTDEGSWKVMSHIF